MCIHIYLQNALMIVFGPFGIACMFCDARAHYESAFTPASDTCMMYLSIGVCLYFSFVFKESLCIIQHNENNNAAINMTYV